MKIGIISDTHIPDRAAKIPDKVLEAFKEVELILHAGDLVDSDVLENLKSVCKEVRAVRGNMDHPHVQQALPEKQIIEIEGHRIGLIHGYGAPNRLIELVTKVFEKDKVDIIVFGHSHSPTNEKKGKVLYFNPGSPTEKIFSPYNSYGILEITKDKVVGTIIKI